MMKIRKFSPQSAMIHLILLCHLMMAAMAARILFHIATPTHSHTSVYHPIIRKLVERGHEVVSITAEPKIDGFEHENLTEIDIGFSSEYWKTVFDVGTAHLTIIQGLEQYEVVLNKLTDLQLSHPPVKALINDPHQHFDLVVVECFKYHATYGWAYRFKAPMALMISLDALYDGHDLIGNPTHPYLISSMIHDFLVGPDISFYHRMRSLYLFIFARISPYTWGRTIHDEVLRKHFGQDAPSSHDIGRNVSLVFLNQNQVINRRPKVPSCIYMNMLHIRDPRPLPEDLRGFFDGGTRGVVYFSLGSNVKSSSLPREKIEIFIEVFSKLPYDILWKWERNHLAGRPANVKLCKWCPQQDILAEKRVALFITQGGQQSMEEAIHYRVPVLGMPLIIDQRQNILHLKVRGAAELIGIDELTKETFYDVIMKMMNDTGYRARMDTLATQIEDQPTKPLDRVIWWLEYVLRHKGAEHLRANILPWYLHLMLDAILVAVLILVLIVYVVYCITRCSRHVKQKQQ